MAFIGLKVPHETARLLGSIPAPGTKIPLEQMHVTVLYLGEDVPIQQIAKVLVATYGVTSCRTPYNLKVGKIKCFPSIEGEGYPIIAPVMSQELHEFYEDLRGSFDKAGISYNKKFPEYKPHVTLAYSEESIKCTQLENNIQWAAHEATLWAGDWGDDRLSATFPFTLMTSPTGFYRNVVKTKK